MINHNTCYVSLGESSFIQNYFDNVDKNTLQYGEYFGFNMSLVSEDLYLQEPVLKEVNDKHKIKGCSIIKLDPYHCYVWHKDALRGAGINLLLTPNVKSSVFFGMPIERSQDQVHFAEMKYEPNTLYLFNTQIMHTVYNFDEPRYLFSVEFEQSKDELSFYNLKGGALLPFISE